MTVRTRSWGGAVSIALGVILMVVVMMTAKIESGIPHYSGFLLGVGALLTAAGLGMIVWAMAGAVKQIGAGDARLEARLRAEAAVQKGSTPPQSRPPE